MSDVYVVRIWIFIGYVICKYSPQIHGFPFRFFLDVFQNAEVLTLDDIQFNVHFFFFSSMDGAFGDTPKKSLSSPRSQSFSPVFFC